MAQLGNAVTIAELASMLNTTQDVQAICTSANINKWSKHKPIHYSQTAPLWDQVYNDDSKFRGMSTEHSQGIYYGLKAGVDNPTAANIHAADWSYVGRPQGGIPHSPYRVDDFWGYEKDERYPTLSGSGLSEGQEAIYTNNTNITTILTRSSLTSIVDVAEVFGGQLDYSRLYLVVLVGNYARAMVCADTGTISAINSNGQENRTFHFPDMSGIINTNYLPMEAKVSVFLVDNYAIDTFRNSWVDMTTAINLGNKPITLPFQVGLTMKFKAPGRIYITGLSLSTRDYRGALYLTTSYTKGQDWELASSYRVVYNVTKTGGGAAAYAVAVDKSSTYIEPSVNEVIMGAGFVKDLTTANYSIQADFQVDEGSGYKTTGYMQTISVTW